MAPDKETNEEVILGNLKAERDPLLADCFIRTKLINQILQFNGSKDPYTRSIVVGSKGAGKTAIYRIGLGARSRIPCVRISPETHSVTVSGIPLSYVHYADILKYELALECLRVWWEDNSIREKLTKEEQLQVKSTVEKYLDRIKKLGGRVNEVSISVASVFGMGVGLSEKKDEPLQVVTKPELEKAMDLLRLMEKKKVKCLILIDDPELLFNPPPDPLNSLLGGLLHASADLTAEVGKSIRVVVLMKLHLFHYMQRNFEDIDHLEFAFQMLKWTQEDLGALLTERLKKSPGLFEDNDLIEKPWALLASNGMGSDPEQVQEYLMARLTNGPGDLIHFAGLILKFRSDGLSGWDAVYAAEMDYSEKKLSFLQNQYGTRGYEGIDIVLRKLFDVGTVPSGGEWEKQSLIVFLRERLAARDMQSLRNRLVWLEVGPKQLANMLFDIGFLGYWSRTANRFVLPYEVISKRRDFEAADRWRIHPAFHTALNIPAS